MSAGMETTFVAGERHWPRKESCLQRSIANLDSTVRNLDRHVGIAYANTSNPVWHMMSGMPQYGGNVAAIHTAVDALHDLSHDALPLMVDAMGDVDLTRFSVEESTRQSP